MENRTVNGWDFKYDEDNEMYECRGDVVYDDDHDEQPEPSLLQAAYHLAQRLESSGVKCEVGASEKGWVEVNILK
jgi:hypothetical protein